MTAVSCKDPQKAPVRELLSLVTVYACLPKTMGLALSLVKAMASNDQFAQHAGRWPDEARQAVGALNKSLDNQLAGDELPLEYLGYDVEKAVAETASAIATLIQKAKLESPPTEGGTPEMEPWILQRADTIMRNAMENALAAAEKFLDPYNEDEANKLLDGVAGFACRSTWLPSISETAAEQMIERAALLRTSFRISCASYSINATRRLT